MAISALNLCKLQRKKYDYSSFTAEIQKETIQFFNQDCKCDGINSEKKKKRVTVTNRRKCQYFSLQLLRNAQYNFNNFGFSKHTQHTHFTFMNTRYSLAYVRSKYNIFWFCGIHQRSKSLSPMRHLFFLFTIYYFHQYLSHKKLLVFL